MSRPDPHSFFDDTQARTKRLRLVWDLDFDSRQIDGEARLTLEGGSGDWLDLDSKGLVVRSVSTGDGKGLPFEMDQEQPILGRRLRIRLPAGTREVAIRYATSADATGLQWLDPAQTEGKRLPFLFSQCQSIHARTVAPLQDSPAARVTYHAEVTLPEALTAVMSAGPSGVRPGPRPGTRTFLFDMPQAIPSYLIAIAAGDLTSRDLSPRSRVWAEPATVEAAAWEFAGIEEMIVKAEGLFGPYLWDRYDMLVLPPSFPYGGMENPRMTFLTPTLLAGDRSLVDVVAHELAHSWTGNLVTNATMDHFWLNEGFTVWAERRIHEALHGAERSVLHWALGRTALQREFERFGSDSPLTRLRSELVGVDPDDAYSAVPYEKGALFVELLERTVGRDRFDLFLRSYIERFRFCSITTEEFVAFLEQELPRTASAVGAEGWLFSAGLPASATEFRSRTLEAIGALAAGWPGGARPGAEQIGRWAPAELVLYLQGLPRELSAGDCAWLDQHLDLTSRGNHEVLVEWLTIAGGSDYEPVFLRVREVLGRVGRMKYLRPLYKALGRHERTRRLAREVFESSRDSYHNLSRRVVEGILAGYPSE